MSGKTVIEADPIRTGYCVSKTGKTIIKQEKVRAFTLEPEQLKEWAERWSDSFLGQKDEISPGCRLNYLAQEARSPAGIKEKNK